MQPEYIDEDNPIFSPLEENFKAIASHNPVEPEITTPVPPKPAKLASGVKDPGLRALYDLAEGRSDSDPLGDSPGEGVDLHRAMSSPPPDAGSDNVAPDVPAHASTSTTNANGVSDDASAPSEANDRDARLTAKLALQESNRNANSPVKDLGLIANMTIASRDGTIQATTHSAARGDKMPPLKIEPSNTTTSAPVDSSLEDTITRSPILSKHVIQGDDRDDNTLPAVQAMSPIKEGGASSPQTQLPSIRQLMTDPLDKLAEAATQQRTHTQPHAYRTHSHSFGSATSPSPMHPSFPYPGNATSPIGHTAYTRSPISIVGDSPNHQSPPAYQGMGYYPRRQSDFDPHLAITLHSHQSVSSSSDSHGTAGSSTDGISTAHTTPIESGSSAEGAGRPILPPPAGLQATSPPGGFRCDYPGCNSIAFQTQYLLSSHKNVHSQSRPHYCSVEGCPRSEGGKGFKRKNEMIRHGLVHDSPGFICPFCEDREHRYPRPDNLQRHVKVHHPEKERDHPDLLKVLNQRVLGASGKQRRRRAPATGSMIQSEAAA